MWVKIEDQHTFDYRVAIAVVPSRAIARIYGSEHYERFVRLLEGPDFNEQFLRDLLLLVGYPQAANWVLRMIYFDYASQSWRVVVSGMDLSTVPQGSEAKVLEPTNV